MKMSIAYARIVGGVQFAILSFICVVLIPGTMATAQPANLPIVTGINPSSGPIGTRVLISGSNLVNALSVRFGTAEAAFGSLTASEELYADVPTNAQTGPVTVVTTAGETSSSMVFTVTVIPPPMVVSLQPASGETGDSITIHGSNFVSVSAVRFNGVDAAFNVFSEETILAVVPSSAASGLVTVITPQGTAASPNAFNIVQAQPPVIQSFTPTSGSVGTSILIQGPNVGQAQKVLFNGVTASFISLGPDRVSASVPAGAKSGPITVITAVGSNTTAAAFTVIAVQGPVISGFSPLKGKVSTPVMLIGSNFNQTTSVKFNGVPASFNVLSLEAIFTSVPLGALTGPITVETALGTNSTSQQFVVTLVGEPQLTGFSPPNGPPGTIVTLTGNNLVNVESVFFNGVPAPFSTNNGLTTVVPLEAISGPISVKTLDGTALSQSAFVVIQQADLLVLVKAEHSSQAQPGTAQFLITVTNLGPKPASGMVVNGSFAMGDGLTTTNWPTQPMTNFSLSSVQVSTGSYTLTNGYLSWEVGSLAAGSRATLNLQTESVPTGTFNCQASVLAIESDPVPANNLAIGSAIIAPRLPQITGFAPSQGLIGSSVLIQGSNLAQVLQVNFGGAPATFTTNDGLRAVVPNGAVTAPISVTTVEGSATSTVPFMVIQPVDLHVLAIASLFTNGLSNEVQFEITLQNPSATAAQGIVVSNFFAIGAGLNASNWPYAPFTNGIVEVIAAGSGEAGYRDGVLVWEPGAVGPGAAVSLQCVFSSLPAGYLNELSTVYTSEYDPDLANNTAIASIQVNPQITHIEPADGPPGTVVQILGSNLTNALSVRFNGTPAVFTEDHGLRATVPADASSGPITVQTTLGLAASGQSFTVRPLADIQVYLAVSASTNGVPSEATFTVTLTNAGPKQASGILVSNVFTLGTTTALTNLGFICQASQGTLDLDLPSGQLTWLLDTLSPAAEAQLRIQASGLPDGTVHCRAISSASEIDPNFTNNLSEVTFDVVLTAPALHISKVANHGVEITWPGNDSSWVLQSATDLKNQGSLWTDFNTTPDQTNGLQRVVVRPADNRSYFRLQHKN
jgi:large repetitive protein